MNQHLTRDEFDALDEVGRLPKGGKPVVKHSACVARNAKRLVGIKLMQYRKDGSYLLTEAGAEALFVKKCIAGLNALATNPAAKLDDPVATFLGRKGYIAVSVVAEHFEITPRGRECLDDIAKNP